MITEPKWKSYMVETTQPIFTPEQCQMVINAGRSEPKQNAAVGSDKGNGGSGIDTEKFQPYNNIKNSKRVYGT